MIIASKNSKNTYIKDEAKSIAAKTQAEKSFISHRVGSFLWSTDNITHCMNHEHSQEDKIVRLNGWGAQRPPGGEPKGLVVSYKYGRVRGTKGLFPR